ncbi:MAG: hypothetical protein HC942_28940 [Microcoleus sp. SU_5_6]|nr:hypothetical protein [Microcoleus sp. SU_5_6]
MSNLLGWRSFGLMAIVRNQLFTMGFHAFGRCRSINNILLKSINDILSLFCTAYLLANCGLDLRVFEAKTHGRSVCQRDRPFPALQFTVQLSYVKKICAAFASDRFANACGRSG